MGIPSPTIPSFTDGTIVHATNLNALASNINNLYTYGQGGFTTQRPCVIAQQTTTQTISGSTDTLVNFNSAGINTNNMWVASQATQLTIQVAGIYLLFAQVRWPPIGAATFPANWAQVNLMVNGTVPSANTIAMNVVPFTTTGSGAANTVSTIANLAAGATVYLDVFAVYSGTASLQTSFGGSFLGAIYQTPST